MTTVINTGRVQIQMVMNREQPKLRVTAWDSFVSVCAPQARYPSSTFCFWKGESAEILDLIYRNLPFCTEFVLNKVNSEREDFRLIESGAANVAGGLWFHTLQRLKRFEMSTVVRYDTLAAVVPNHTARTAVDYLTNFLDVFRIFSIKVWILLIALLFILQAISRFENQYKTRILLGQCAAVVFFWQLFKAGLLVNILSWEKHFKFDNLDEIAQAANMGGLKFVVDLEVGWLSAILNSQRTDQAKLRKTFHALLAANTVISEFEVGTDAALKLINDGLAFGIYETTRADEIAQDYCNVRVVQLPTLPKMYSGLLMAKNTSMLITEKVERAIQNLYEAFDAISRRYAKERLRLKKRNCGGKNMTELVRPLDMFAMAGLFFWYFITVIVVSLPHFVFELWGVNLIEHNLYIWK